MIYFRNILLQFWVFTLLVGCVRIDSYQPDISVKPIIDQNKLNSVVKKKYGDFRDLADGAIIQFDWKYYE